MTYEYAGNTIPAPGLSTKNPSSYDPEIKFSSAGFTQKGGTLKGGQGILLAGTVVAREETTKQWVKYASGGSDGASTAVGVLRKTTDTGADGLGKYQGNIVIAGILKLHMVSSANGSELAAAVTALGAHTSTALDTFSF